MLKLEKIFPTMYKMGILAIATLFGKEFIYGVANKFLEGDSLPVKVNYVDWWPRVCQKVRDFVSHFWSRRVEGATATTLSSLGMGGAWFFSGHQSMISSFWDFAKKTTESCFNLLGIENNLGMGDSDLTTFWFFPSIVGIGTSLTLGSYDLIQKYFDKDRVLEMKPIFNQKLQQELDEILAAVNQTKEEKGFFENILLFGPPGTGKTTFSKWIAKETGMNYMFIAGGDLFRGMNEKPLFSVNPTGAAVTMLQNLIERAKGLTSPTVVFIDEAEACFRKRDKDKTTEFDALLNKFLQLTSQDTSKMMLICATNRPEDMDAAVLSRLGRKVYIGPPELAERKSMIKMNIDILIHLPENRRIFTEENIDYIAKQTQGFSGRDLFRLVNRLKTEAGHSRSLDHMNIDKVIKKIVREEIKVGQISEEPLKGNPFYKNLVNEAG